MEPQTSNLIKKKGKKGKKLHLITNYVKVSIDQKDGIHEYRTSFKPSIDNLEIRKKFLNQFEEILGMSRVFDGMSLFLPFKLKFDVMVFDGVHPKHPNTGINMTVTYVQRKPYRQLIQFFNILLRRVMTVIGKFELKNSFFDPNCKFDLPQYKLQVWPGICTSVEEQEDGLMLLLDTSYRVFKTDTVYDYICALNDVPNWEEDFKKYIIGKVVVTRYNNFTYKVDDIDWERNPSSTFNCNGKETTYKDYYKNQYNMDINDPNQPLLLSRIKVKNGYRETENVKVVSIVPELCYVTGMNQEHRNDEIVMKEVARYTFCTPAQRVKALKAFVERLNEIPEALQVLSSWNVKMSPSLLEVPAREITGPSLKVCDGVQITTAGHDFTIQASKGCYDPIKLKRWLVICSQRDVKLVKRFVECYTHVCKDLGISIPQKGEIITLKGQNPNDFREALEDYVDPQSVQFVVVVMPYIRREIYSIIKTVCCMERPLASQVILAKNLMNENLLQTVKHVVMQINCKLGGSLWGLRIPLQERIMFVGIDVHHDVKKVEPSTVALIASMNNTCTKYFSKVHIQRIHQEITDNMQSLFSEALECYREMNGAYPQRIIVFRDGGSLSAMPLLLEHEVKPMLLAIQQLCPELKNFTYTVVAKRVPQRFFSENKHGFFENPQPGTVIDESVTYPGMFDFYIVSQQKKHGTITPTHYMVIYDMGGIKPDLMQKFAYCTTFMYYNWAGSIRVPAMVQYAHKLSSLVGQYLKMDPSKRLETFLYYL